VGDVEDVRLASVRIVNHVHLHAADAAIGFGPVADLAERDGGGIDQAQQKVAIAAGLAIQLGGDQAESLGKHRHGAAFAGIRQRRTPQRCAAQVIVVLDIGIPALQQAAQAPGAAQLGIDQRHQMIPASERLVIGVAIVPVDDRLERPPVDDFQQGGEDGR
jgi:hypothetical protein